MQKTKSVSKIGFLVFMAIIILFYVLLDISVNSMILCGSFILMIFLLMLYKPSSSGIDVFEPLYFFAGTIALVFYIAPMAWITRGQVAYQGMTVMHMLPLATLYVNLGFIAFYMGYAGKTNVKLGNNGCKKIKGLRLVNVAWLFLIVSMLCALLYDRSQGIGISDILSYFSAIKGKGDVELTSSFYNFLNLFHNSMVSSYLVILFLQKKKGIFTYGIGVFVALMLLVSGSRYRLLIFLVAPLIVYYLNKRKRPSTRSIVIAVIGMFLVTSVVGLTRTAFKTGGVVENISLNTMIEAFSYNIDVFFPFYRIIDYMPQNLGYRFGMSYLEIILQFIPSAIWPNKPATTMSIVMNAAFGRLASGGPSYTIFGEHYVEFGIVGIVLVLFFIGKELKYLWNNIQKKNSVIYNVEYAILFVYILQLVTRGHTASKVFELLFFCGPFLIFKRCGKGE